jgi:hypothetical protein
MVKADQPGGRIVRPVIISDEKRIGVKSGILTLLGVRSAAARIIQSLRIKSGKRL